MAKKYTDFTQLEEIGKRLKALRGQIGKTTYDVAEVFDVSNGTVSRWETGKTEPPLGYILFLADKTSCNLDWLLFGEKDKTASSKNEYDDLKCRIERLEKQSEREVVAAMPTLNVAAGVLTRNVEKE